MSDASVPELRARRGRVVVEALVAAALVAAAIGYGRVAFLHPLAAPDYYYLGPSAMIASGQGFQRPAPGVPAFAAFLSRSVDRVTADELHNAQLQPLDQFDHSARYLLSLIGYWWRVTDISWARAADIGGLFHALAVGGLYAWLRLMMPLPWAAAGALWLCTSTLQLSLVPHLRDYSKGAFIIAAIPLLSIMSLAGPNPRLVYGSAAAAGALIGLGLGFKRDVFVMVPLGLALMVLFRDRRPWTGLMEKAKVGAIFTGTFLVVSAPVSLPLVDGGSHTMHVTLLGFSREFNHALGVEPSVHQLVPFYNDAYVGMMVRAYEQNFSAATFEIPSAGYDRAGERLWLAILRNFPADMVARTLASTNQILNLVFLNPDPSVVTVPLPAGGAFTAAYTWLHRLNGYGWVLAVAAVAIAAAWSLRHALWAAVLMIALAGYPTLQFMPRHYLYLQVIPVAAIALLLSRTVRLPSGKLPVNLARVVAAVAALSAIVTLPLMVLRPLQQTLLARALDGWTAGARSRVHVEAVAQPAGTTLLQWPTPRGVTLYYELEFAPDAAEAAVIAALRYRSVSPATDYSRVLAMTSPRDNGRIGFAAIHEPGVTEFVGVEVGPRAMARLRGVYRVDAGGPLKMPLDLRLPGDWRERLLYQRLSIEGPHPRAMTSFEVICAGAPGCPGLLQFAELKGEELPSLASGRVTRVHAPIVAAAADGVRVRGIVENDSSYLFQMAEHEMKGGGAFVMHGTLDHGGINVGLLRHGAWFRPVVVRGPGAFIIVVPIDEPGIYTPLITNAMTPGQRHTQVHLTSAGFVE